MTIVDKVDPTAGSPNSDFAEQATSTPPGLIREFWDFLRYNKKWWLTPIILVILLIGVLVFLGSTPAAPFIYTLF